MPKANILVLDDDPVVRRALTDTLTDEGYQVQTATNGAEGLEKAKKQDFNLALVDIRLPDVSGMEVLQALKEMAPDIEVLIITAYPGLETAIEAVRLGAYDYLVKPFADADLLIKIEHALEKHRLALTNRQLLQETTSILGSMIDAVVVANPDGTIRTLNRAALELLGYSEQELIGQPVGIIFEKEEEEEAAFFFKGTGLAKLVREGTARDVEMTLRTRSGERVPVVFNGSVIRGDDGQLVAVGGLARDMRETRRLWDEILRAEATLRSLNAASLAVQRALQPEDVFRAVASELKKLDFFTTIFLLDEDKKNLMIAHTSFSPGLIKRAEKLTGLRLSNIRFPLDRIPQYIREVLGNRVAVFSQAGDRIEGFLPAHLRGLTGKLVDILGLQKGIVAPLVLEGEVIGALGVDSRELTENDVPAITAFANQVSIALENARLYEQARQEIAERKRVEEALQASYRHQASILGSMLDAVIVANPDGTIRTLNRAALELLGYSEEELIGQPVGIIFEEEEEEEEEEEAFFRGSGLVKLVREGAARDVELTLRTRSGERIPVVVNSSVIRGEDGQLLAVVGVARDITERKRAEERLQESKRQLESRERFISRILDSIPTSLVVIDRSQRIASVNRNFLEKTRREAQATLGRKIEEVFPQVLLEYTRLDQKVREIFHTGEPIEGGKVAYRAPGLPTRVYYYRLIPLKCALSRAEAAEEAVENAMLLMDDITEREKLGEEVRRAERHLASVVDSAYDLVVSMNPEGRILTWNRAAERTSGFEIEEVKGQYLLNLCVEEGQQEMGSWLAQLARGRFTKKSVEINLRTKEEGDVPISWAGSRMLDDEHRIVGLVAVGRDLTERKRLEAQLIKSAKLTSLGVMAGGIAHEIRNPLAISSAAAQLLLESPEDEELREGAVKRIHSGIQRASYIIENLLKFARPPEERMVSMDIDEALEETLSLLANQLKVQQVELRKDLAPDLLPVVGNKSLLQQVFSNMILNACNVMPDGGRLTITTRVNSGNQVEIQFADTGCGIPKESLSAIFDPFFTTMPVGKGVGLGLSISYSIIKQHRGKIDVESKVGVGSTFTVRLPGAMDEKEG